MDFSDLFGNPVLDGSGAVGVAGGLSSSSSTVLVADPVDGCVRAYGVAVVESALRVFRISIRV